MVLTELERTIQSQAKRLVEENIQPRAAELDRNGTYPWENLKLLAQHGFLGVTMPSEYGGMGQGLRLLCLIEEEIARGCATTSQTLIGHYLCMTSILWHGSEEQKRRWLPRLARGEQLGTFGITEPEGGSDVSTMATTAAGRDGAFVLNGRKRFVGNASTASVYVVFAATDPAKRARGITSFVVERGTSGFATGTKEDMMGLRGADVGDLIFTDCRLPAGQVLGTVDRGFHQAMATLDVTRPVVGAQAVGVAQAAFEEAVAYARRRVIFGKPVADHQGIQFMLANMYADILASRLLVLHAASMHDTKAPRFTKEASAAKVFATEAATRVVSHALQIHGGYGYTKGCPVERMYRDVRVFEIYEGTSEIQRLVIAKRILEETA